MSDDDKGLVTTEGFGSRERMALVETASSAVAAQAKAGVQARYVMAMQNPRSWDEARVRLLRECSRPGFAEVARYSKPVGGSSIVGFSIRFAEAALRCAGNMLIESMTIYDDADQRIVRVSVTDLESNVSYPKDIVIRKVVERSRLSDGQTPISVRTNSQGRKTYTVQATDDDLLNKENALISKALRTAALRMIPGDILDECEARIIETVKNRVTADPEAERKRIVDGFAALNVMPQRIVEYLGHPIEEVTPAELADLKLAYASIRDGEATMAAMIEERHGKPQPQADEMTPAEKATKGLREKLAKPPKAAPETPTREQSEEIIKEALDGAIAKPATMWNAKGACVGCGRHQETVAHSGHMKDCPLV